MLELQGQLFELAQTWTTGIDDALIGILGFNPESFLTDVFNNIGALTQQFADFNLGTWQFNADNWTFDISTAFLDIFDSVQNILQNDETFEIYFIDVLDQLYVDFEALSGDWVWYDTTLNQWQFDVELLSNLEDVQQFLNELSTQLDNLTIEEIQGWLVLDPLQELFNQLSEQLNEEQQATLNDILEEIGLPELSIIVSSSRTDSVRPMIEYVRQTDLSLQGVMAITLNYNAVSDYIANGASLQDAVAFATGHDHFADLKPNNNPSSIGTLVIKFIKNEDRNYNL